MSRSIKKGPYVEEALMKKLKDDSSDNGTAENMVVPLNITPDFVGYTCGLTVASMCQYLL